MDRIAIKVRVYVFFIMRYLKNCQKILKWAKLSCQASWNGVGEVGIEGLSQNRARQMIMRCSKSDRGGACKNGVAG